MSREDQKGDAGQPTEAFYRKVLEIILENLDWGIQVTDRDGYTIYYNEAASRIDGIAQEDAIGKHVLEMFPSLSEEGSTILKVLRTGKPSLKQEQEIMNLHGRKFYLYTSTIPVIIDGEIRGAVDISKDLSEIKDLMEKVIGLREEVKAYRKLDKNLSVNEEAYYTFDDIIGESMTIKEIKEKMLKAARGNFPIFVYGETGTGKELLVQAIHNASPRRKGPFIAQNCAALPENLMEAILFGTVKGSFTGAENRPGLVELADGGTLFLDEITCLRFDLQAKLLRFLQEGYVRRIGDNKVRKVDVRVMSATNVEPQEALEKKLLRPDLFYRLNVMSLRLPPLRERMEDIPLLVKSFISQFNRQLGKDIQGISREVEGVLMNYQWPGNIRELRGVIEYAANFCDGKFIQLQDLPEYILKNAYEISDKEINLEEIDWDQDLRSFLQAMEAELIRRALKKAHGTVSKAAKMLGIPRQTLQYKMKILGIEMEDMSQEMLKN